MRLHSSKKPEKVQNVIAPKEFGPAPNVMAEYTPPETAPYEPGNFESQPTEYKPQFANTLYAPPFKADSQFQPAPAQESQNVLAEQPPPETLPVSEHEKYWGQGVGTSKFNMPLDRFVQVAGMAANAFAPDEPSGRLGKELSQLGRESYLTRMKMADERTKDLLLQKRSASKNALEAAKTEADIKYTKANTASVEAGTEEKKALFGDKAALAKTNLAIAEKNLEILNNQGKEIRETFIQESTGKKFGRTLYGEIYDLQTKVKLTQEESDALYLEKYKKERQVDTEEMKKRGINTEALKKQNPDYKSVGTSNGIPVFMKEGKFFSPDAKGKLTEMTTQFTLDGAVKEQKGDFSEKDFINIENQFLSLAVNEKGETTDKHAILTDPGKQALLRHWQKKTNHDYTYFIKQVPKTGWYSGKVTMEPTFMKVQLPIIKGRQWTNQMVREAAAESKMTYEEVLERIVQKQEQEQAQAAE
jgi:hypothetical protein